MPNRSSRLIVLYDGQCPLCIRTVQRLQSLKLRAELEPIPYQQADLPSLAPGITADDAQFELHVLDGDAVYRGADAVLRIMREIPALRPLGWIAKLPFGNAVSKRMYRYIADRRYEWFGKNETCEDGACSIHRPKD